MHGGGLPYGASGGMGAALSFPRGAVAGGEYERNLPGRRVSSCRWLAASPCAGLSGSQQRTPGPGLSVPLVFLFLLVLGAEPPILFILLAMPFNFTRLRVILPRGPQARPRSLGLS